MSHFRQKCLRHERTIGTFVAIPHPVAVEVTAAAGVDFICIDAEHAQIGRELIENLIRASDVHQVPALVRVPGHAPESIAGVLDGGAAGVLVPRISDAKQAKAAVMATRFPPLGERGVGPGRAAGYGYRIPDYLRRANEDSLLAIQIETAEGLTNVHEIVAVEGIDVVFIGPGDLSVSMNALGPEGVEKLDAAINKIAQAARAAGKAVGIFRPSPDDIGRWSDAGINFYLLASDTMFLGAAVASGITTARNA
jgi:4-hydroxy-2-oxoheptanedioate aldolase